MKRIGNVILMVGWGVLLTFATAAPARAQATDVVCTGCVASTDIADLGVASADLAGSAVTSAKIANSAVTSAKIADGTITNADISSSAAIAGTKVAPNFGSQNVTTTGNVGIGTASPFGALHVVGKTFLLDGTSVPSGVSSIGVGQTNATSDSYSVAFGVLGQNKPRLIVLGNGNVGIGTTGPISPLTIKTVGMYSLLIKNAADTATLFQVMEDTGGSGLFDLMDPTGAGLGVRLSAKGNSFILGNVGIGTTSPGQKLSVTGTIESTSGGFKFPDGSVQTSAASGSTSAWAVSGDNIYNTNTSSVGIGTAGPQVPLHIMGSINAPSNSATPNGSMILGSAETGVQVAMGVTADVSLQYGWVQPRYSNNNTNYNLVLNPNGGNVGIGTTGPGAKLQVGDGTSASGKIRLKGYSASGRYADIAFEGDNFSIGDSVNGTNLFIQYNGNVGIGTTGPAQKLDVVGGNIRLDNGQNIVFGPGTNNGITGNDALDTLTFRTAAQDRMTIKGGNVGIGTTSPGDYKLAVKGKIHAEEVVVDTGWADFVFKKDYDLMPLEKVARHIEKVGHLPGIPSEQEVKENGINIGQIQFKLLQKIEEMTLYVIELKKENDQLKERISSLENKSM